MDSIRSRCRVRFFPTAVVLAVLLLSTGLTFAEWHSLGKLSFYITEGNRVTLNCDPAKVTLTLLAPDLVRVRLAPTGIFGPDESWAVVKRDWLPFPFQVADQDSIVLVETSELKIHVRKSPCRIAFFEKSGGLINQDDPSKGMAWDGYEVCYWKTLPVGETYYGFGEKTGPLDKRGQAMAMWNTDAYNYNSATDPLYQSIPFFIGYRSGESYGIFFDNTFWSFFDMGKASRNYYSFGAEDGDLDYYFFYGPELKDVLSRYTELVGLPDRQAGRMPLPPKWALGYQQCRWSYFPESKVRDIARNFRQRQIPCDVIYLDIDYMDGYRCFTWDKERFPDPKKMVSELGAQGFKIVVIIDPGIKQDKGYWVYDQGLAGDHFCKLPDGRLYVGRVWPGECVFPDFTREGTRQWWGRLYSGLLDVGIRGFWNDMNEPAIFGGPGWSFPIEVIHDDRGHHTDHRKSHNVYGMLMARGTYEGVRALRPNQRPFVLTRAGFAGEQRYAAMWTGDNTANYEHLRLTVPMVLNMGLSGVAFAGPDIGGFSGSPDGELYTRWLELGALLPFCRTHTAWGTKNQEPWSYGQPYEDICRRYIELRYRLLPYLYTLFYEATQTGVPVVRPIFMEFPEDARQYEQDPAFLLGPSLLIAPVLSEDQTERAIRLPQGRWFNFWTEEAYDGGAEIGVPTPLETLPIFVRGGAILPTQQVVQYTDQAPIDPLTLEIYPHGTSAEQLYEDDGESFDYERGISSLTIYECSARENAVTFSIAKREGKFLPSARHYVLKFHGSQWEPLRVTLSGKSLPRFEGEGLQDMDVGWSYDPQTRIVWVRFPDRAQAEIVELQR